jgi:asparagine synthase (glutamine-hydrolysing)
VGVPVRLTRRDLEHVVKLDAYEPGYKTERLFQRTRDGTLILRQVIARHVRDVLLDPGAKKLYGFFSRGVQSLVKQHLDGRENRRLLRWSLLSFERWRRSFLHAWRP